MRSGIIPVVILTGTWTGLGLLVVWQEKLFGRALLECMAIFLAFLLGYALRVSSDQSHV